MLQDIDLKYSSGVLTTQKSVSVGGSLTVTGATSVGSGSTVGGTPIVRGDWGPADHGLIAWSTDPSTTTTASLAVNGTVYLARLNVRVTSTITRVWYVQTVGMTTPTAGQNFTGIYNSSGTLLTSASTDSATTAGLKTISLDTPQSVSAGFIWAAFVWNASTAPTVMRGGGQNSAANIANLSAANYRWATNGTGQTSLPASITPSSNSQTGVFALWAAVD